MCALKVAPHGRTQPPQNVSHEGCAAKHCAQGEKYELFQPSDTPHPQMHPAPLGVDTRRHIVLVNVTTHEELDHQDPEEAGEGKDKGEQEHQETDADELPDVRGHEELAYFRRSDEPQKAYQGGGV